MHNSHAAASGALIYSRYVAAHGGECGLVGLSRLRGVVAEAGVHFDIRAYAHILRLNALASCFSPVLRSQVGGSVLTDAGLPGMRLATGSYWQGAHLKETTSVARSARYTQGCPTFSGPDCLPARWLSTGLTNRAHRDCAEFERRCYTVCSTAPRGETPQAGSVNKKNLI